MEENKLYCEDNVSFCRRLPDNYVDLTVTSPPYDSLRAYNGYSWDFNALAEELYRITSVGGVVVWVVGDATVNGSETGTSFRQALHFMDVGFMLYDTMIYQKANPMPKNSPRYEQAFEYMFVLSKGKPKCVNLIMEPCIYAGDKSSGTMRNSGKDTLSVKQGADRNIKSEKPKNNIWRYATGNGHNTRDKISFQHPATFPEALARDHIISWSNEGDLVFDPFVGSGTTAKMAKLNNRNYIGCDISQEYIDIANQRLNTGGLWD